MLKKINNISLKKKLLLIMQLGLFIMAAMSFLMLQIVLYYNEKMLYQIMSESMSYSAKEITDYMDKMESLTQIFLSDEEIQTNMSILKDMEEESVRSNNALRKLGNSVSEYYQNYRDGIMKYISLYTPETVLKTNLILADKVSKDARREMLIQADELSGAPHWIDDYVEEYGMFLVRNIRRIEGLKLDTLGTIMINIDMDALIRASTGFEKKYGENAYVISDNGTIIYHTDNLECDGIEKLAIDSIKDYKIQKINGKTYFISHGRIKEYGWDYYSFISYDEIEENIKKIKAICFWVIGVDFILIMCMATGLIGKLMQHISNLKGRMQTFALDNTRVPETNYDYSGRKDEIGTLNRQFDEMSKTIINLIHQNYTNELLKKEAQIKALENQINPHFLYNTLDSIKWRAKLYGQTDISDMVEALGILLRTTLRKKDEAHYTLRKEMEIVSSYITIQKFRYEERLVFDNQIDVELYSVEIPRLVIQPLLENAIFYGLETNVDECEIVLSAKMEKNLCHFYVKNTGSEMEENLLEKLRNEEIKPHGHGVGLLNIDKRIKIQYGEIYGLQMYNDGEYAVAELVFPVNKGVGDAEINHSG